MATNRIKEIQAKLTGDSKKDAQILYEAVQKHPEDVELQKFVLNIAQSMKNNKKKEKKALSPQDFEKRLSTAKNHIDKKEFEKAIKTLNRIEPDVLKVMDAMKKMEPNHNTTFKYFYNMMEYDLFEDFYKEDNRTILMIPYDYVSLLTLRGQAYFFLEEPQKSEESFREALNYNPTCCDLIFLMADFHFQMFQWFSFTMDLDKLVPFLYKESDYLSYYRYLAQYYQKYEMDMLLASLLNDLGNEKSNIPLSKRWENLSDKQKQMLDDKKIPYSLSENVVKVCIQKAKDALLENKMEHYRFYVQVLLPFLKENDITKMITGK